MSVESKIARLFLDTITGYTAPELADLLMPEYSYTTVQTATSRLAGAMMLVRSPRSWPHRYHAANRAGLTDIANGGAWRGQIKRRQEREHVLNVDFEKPNKYDFALLANCMGHYSYRS